MKNLKHIRCLWTGTKIIALYCKMKSNFHPKSPFSTLSQMKGHLEALRPRCVLLVLPTWSSSICHPFNAPWTSSGTREGMAQKWRKIPHGGRPIPCLLRHLNHAHLRPTTANKTRALTTRTNRCPANKTGLLMSSDDIERLKLDSVRQKTNPKNEHWAQNHLCQRNH